MSESPRSLGADELEPLALLAKRAALDAGALLLEYYDGSTPSSELAASVSSKTTRTDLVTAADKESERLVIERILAERPDDGILAEEGGSRPTSSGLTWVIDPLDGTINYVYGFPVFNVSIACQMGDDLLVGAVHDPLRDETFLAMRGHGAVLNGEPLEMGDGPSLAEALVATGFGYEASRRLVQARLLETILPEVRDIRRAGAAAQDLCWIAAGRVDACYESGLMAWDLAAGSLVVTEAGGTVQLVDGLIPDIATLVAGPSRLVVELVALLERARESLDAREAAGL